VVIETPVMMEVAEVAARPGKMRTRKAAPKSAAHTSAAESTTHVSTTESATNVSTAESAAHVTATATVSPPAAAPAPRKRVGAQGASESGSCSQNDHGLT
jgi:hypothetical protein